MGQFVGWATGARRSSAGEPGTAGFFCATQAWSFFLLVGPGTRELDASIGAVLGQGVVDELAVGVNAEDGKGQLLGDGLQPNHHQRLLSGQQGYRLGLTGAHVGGHQAVDEGSAHVIPAAGHQINPAVPATGGPPQWHERQICRAQATTYIQLQLSHRAVSEIEHGHSTRRHGFIKPVAVGGETIPTTAASKALGDPGRPPAPPRDLLRTTLAG